jgi:hypothetical protein
VQAMQHERECRTLVDNPEGKRPLGRSRRKWDYNIEMVLI